MELILALTARFILPIAVSPKTRRGCSGGWCCYTKVPEPGSVVGLLALAGVGATAANAKRKRQEKLLAKAETV